MSDLREILEYSEHFPNLHLKISNICLKAGFIEKDVAMQFSVREITAHDYFRNESSKAVVNYAKDML
jgi:hypothetical protein